jgi:hypothetical protein
MSTGVSIIMAGALWRDLSSRGVKGIGLSDCEAMIARMLDCARTLEPRIAALDDAPPRRCDTSEVDLDGSCMACGAIEGERCQQPEGRQ